MMITYIYFIQQGYGAIKIGVSNNPEKRLASMQTASSKFMRILAKIPLENRALAFSLEKELHARLKRHRIRGEWFNRRIIKDGQMQKIFGGTLKNPYQKAYPDIT